MQELFGITEHLSIEFFGLVIVYIGSLIKIWFYYNKKIQKFKKDVNIDIKEQLEKSYNKHEVSVCNRFDKMETEIKLIENKQCDTDKQYKELTDKIDKLIISVAKITTFVTGKLNGSSNNGNN